MEVLHDALNRAVRERVTYLEATTVARAFVASLRSRRFEHWSSLASFAVARTLPEHAFAPMSNGHTCRICGANVRVDVFASDHFTTSRMNGVVRTDSLRYTLFDLEAFAREVPNEPGDDDRIFFRTALARIAANQSLGMEFAARSERKLFLDALGVCGIVTSKHGPRFWPAFVPFENRAAREPAPYARDGLSVEALKAFGFDTV